MSFVVRSRPSQVSMIYCLPAIALGLGMICVRESVIVGCTLAIIVVAMGANSIGALFPVLTKLARSCLAFGAWEPSDTLA